MEELQNLQSRVDAILQVSHTRPPAHTVQATAEKVVAAPSASFSPFDPVQAQQANLLAQRFVQLANSAEGTAGLQAVLDETEKAAATENPELVRYALMLFITHHPTGNQLKIKPLEKRAPQLVLPSKKPAVPLQAEARVAKTTTVEATATQARVTAAVPPSEALLNWFREDPKANEHHEHWHLVYPFTGDPVTGRTRDRQGELFLYMHEQMLARYNAERLAVGLHPVIPLPSLDDYSEQVPDGYTPDPNLVEGHTPQGQLLPYSSRPKGTQFADLGQSGQPTFTRIAELKRSGDNLRQAAQSGTFQDGTSVTTDLLGATIEASIDSVSAPGNGHAPPLTSFYGNHHNFGHVFLANANNPKHYPSNVPGVMNTPVTAIRDPIFFRWHKHIDDLSFLWQQQQPPNNFSDAPPVLIRKGLGGNTPEHRSPDIILCFKDVVLPLVPDDADASWQAFGETTFGGANWNTDFSSSKTTTAQLQTTMRKRLFVFTEDNNRTETISYLYPREFFYFLRVEIQVNEDKDVTVRIFLAPTGSYSGIAEVSEDRRMWIELDKFRHTLPASAKAVIFRRADASSVIRRPAVKKFGTITMPNPQADADDDRGDVSCDCGWPYNLLLPRGTAAGMNFRLLVMITDWAIDQVPDDSTCGSMSYCGAKDRYPDSRGMGYPFNLPFPAGQTIAQTITAQKNMAARDITIKLVNAVPG
jgi:tyrosinase